MPMMPEKYWNKSENGRGNALKSMGQDWFILLMNFISKPGSNCRHMKNTKIFYRYLDTNGEMLDRQWKGQPARTVSIATGKCASGYIRQMARTLEKRYNGLQITVYAIENEFFGENVTVTGLLTGTDIVRQLRGM